MLATFIADNFKKGEPIFFADLRASGMKDGNIKYHLNEMIKKGDIERAIPGVFYIPSFCKGRKCFLDADLIATRKYIKKGNSIFGFFSGTVLANRLHMSNQVPRVYTIVSNKAPALYREINLDGFKYILKKPVAKITSGNVHVLQLLELLKDYDSVVEEEACDCRAALKKYILQYSITLKDIDRYIKLFPQKVYKTIYETGIYAVLAQ